MSASQPANKAPREFLVEVRGDVIIRLDQSVLDVVDEDWRDQFYELWTDDEIVEHVCYNLLVNRIPLSSMDGWADQPKDRAELIVHDRRIIHGWDFDVQEIFGERHRSEH